MIPQQELSPECPGELPKESLRGTSQLIIINCYSQEKVDRGVRQEKEMEDCTGLNVSVYFLAR
jgi:hypothetical protein